MERLFEKDFSWRLEAEALADALLREKLDPAVVGAIARVPRHLFIPPELRGRAYDDCALPLSCDQTISQPFVVAVMTELLEIERGMRVLEVGTGSGYQTAVLCEMGAEVYSVEIIPDLSERAGSVLRTLGYHAARLRIGDGAEGWPEYAPYEGVVVTAAAGEVPRTLIDQLACGGRMVVPLEDAGGAQWIWALKKNADGEIERVKHLAVRFVPLTGRTRGH